MDQSRRNAMWVRWLERRPLATAALERLARDASSPEPVADSLLDDLDMHRQLAALGRLEAGDPDFVNRMTDCFRRTVAAGAGTGLPGGPQTHWIENAVSATTQPAKTPQSVGESIQIRTASPGQAARRRAASPNRRVRLTRQLALVLVVLAGGGLIWYVTGIDRPRPLTETFAEPSRSGQPASPQDRPLADPRPEKSGDGPGLAERAGDPDERMAENPFRKIPRHSPDTTPQIPESGNRERHSDPLATFAMVREVEPCDWSSQPPAGGRVGPGRLELVSGTALLTFDHGSTLQMTGPAELELVSPRRILCLSGEFHGRHSAQRDPFVVESAAGKVVPDSRSQFEVRVKPDGQTDLLVQEGAIDVLPWHARLQGEPMLLSPRGLDRGTIEKPDDRRPVLASFENGSGDFEGWVNVNGSLLKSANRPFVDDVLAKASQQWKERPEAFETEWQNLVSLVNGDRDGPVRFDGQRFPMPAFEAFIRKSRENRTSGDSSQNENPFHSRGGTFQGVIEINGTRIQFDSMEEFEAEQKKLLGSFADSLKHFRK